MTPMQPPMPKSPLPKPTVTPDTRTVTPDADAPDRLHIIGLTGGIASGKSTVSAYLRRLGATVVDADVLAREAVAPGSDGLAAVVAQFGDDMLTPDGALDRRRLGEVIFNDAEARKRLNAIVHPYVRRRMQEEIAAAAAAGRSAVVLDIPLLFEGGLNEMCDEVWVVLADVAQQRARLQARDGFDAAAADARIAAQWPLAEKAKLATVVIDNRGTIAETEAQVRREWERVQAGHAAS